MRAVCDRIIHWGLVALIVFTPLAFGTVEPWSIAIMEWGIVTIVLVFALSRLWPSGEATPVAPPRRGPVLLGIGLPIGMFLLLTILQMVPLPLPWLEVISPGSARMYTSVDLKNWESSQVGATEARAGRQDPLLQLEERARRPISVNPVRTRGKVVQLGTLVALFFMVACWVDGGRAVSILKTVTVVGFLVAVFGLVQLLTWNGKIFWVRSVPHGSGTMPRVFGPFVNHNHFAGYVEMIIPVALSLALWLVGNRRTPSFKAASTAQRDGWSSALPDGSNEERGRLSRVTLATFAAVILIVSLLISLSRGGILSAFISGAILLILLCRRIVSRLVRVSIVLALPTVVIAMLALIGAEAVKKQLGTYANLSRESSFRLRVIIWERVIREMPAYAWVGSGLGAFEDSFAPVSPAGSQGRWDRAHNDYLQLLWETGIAGGLLFVLGSGIFIRRYWWPALLGHERPVDLFRVGMAVSLLSIALHSSVDFCLQIGANGFLCALLGGLIVALHRTPDTGRAGPPSVQAIHAPWVE